MRKLTDLCKSEDYSQILDTLLTSFVKSDEFDRMSAKERIDFIDKVDKLKRLLSRRNRCFRIQL